jgi:hypothetical protein
MQIIPNDLEMELRVGRLSGVADVIRSSYYDPIQESPAVRLFDPGVTIPLGALYDVAMEVSTEASDQHCPKLGGELNDCTWVNLWKHRFCMYNLGRQDDEPDQNLYFCLYANSIIGRSEQYAPHP